MCSVSREQGPAFEQGGFPLLVLGQVIRSYREEVLRVSQEQFARRLGTSARTIHRWERSYAEPSRLAYLQLIRFSAPEAVSFGEYLESQLLAASKARTRRTPEEIAEIWEFYFSGQDE